MKVVDVMTSDPVTVTPSETIGQADGLMDENNFRQLPVSAVENWWASSPTAISARF